MHRVLFPPLHAPMSSTLPRPLPPQYTPAPLAHHGGHRDSYRAAPSAPSNQPWDPCFSFAHSPLVHAPTTYHLVRPPRLLPQPQQPHRLRRPSPPPPPLQQLLLQRHLLGREGCRLPFRRYGGLQCQSTKTLAHRRDADSDGPETPCVCVCMCARVRVRKRVHHCVCVGSWMHALRASIKIPPPPFLPPACPPLSLSLSHVLRASVSKVARGT